MIALALAARSQDGSSNIDCGVSIGTIYGIYKRAEGSAANADCVLRVRPCARAPSRLALPRCVWPHSGAH